MGDISEHFSRHEFACQCSNAHRDFCKGNFNSVDIELVNALELIRETLGKIYNADISLHIFSGNRCIAHNAEIPNSGKRSFHTRGLAVDMQSQLDTNVMLSPSELYDTIDELFPDRYGLKLYSNRVHFDVRPNRWRKR